MGSGCAGEQAAGAEKPSFNFSQPYPEEEEVDEGFEADDDAFKDSPNPSEHVTDQRTGGIRDLSDESSEEDPYMNDTVVPTSPSADSTVLLAPSEHDSSAGESTYCLPQTPSCPQRATTITIRTTTRRRHHLRQQRDLLQLLQQPVVPDHRCLGTNSPGLPVQLGGRPVLVSTHWPGTTHFLTPAPAGPHWAGSCLSSTPLLHPPWDEDIPPQDGPKAGSRAGLRPISCQKQSGEKMGLLDFNTKKPRELHFAQSLRKLACSVENLAVCLSWLCRRLGNKAHCNL